MELGKNLVLILLFLSSISAFKSLNQQKHHISSNSKSLKYQSYSVEWTNHKKSHDVTAIFSNKDSKSIDDSTSEKTFEPFLNTLDSWNDKSFDSSKEESVQLPTINPIPQILLFAAVLAFLVYPAEPSYALPFDLKYGQLNPNWDRYFLAGGICCTISHTVSVPFDVVKTKKQANPDLSGLGVIPAFQQIIKNDGLSVLTKGFGPTLIGYFIQGSLKYGFYEIFKPFVAAAIHGGVTSPNSIASLMIAGIMADFIGALSLSPFEAARIRLVANPEYSSNLLDCMIKMTTAGGIASLFESFIPMLSKHLPYTAVQLSSYETITTSIYSYLQQNEVEDVSSWHVQVSFTAAAISAILSTLASQPGDTLMTLLNKSRPKLVNTVANDRITETVAETSSPSGIIRFMVSNAKDLGFKGLYVGTQARLLHVAIIVIVQLLVYDYIKLSCGLPITGGH